MWAKIGEYFLRALVLPLIQKIFAYIQERVERYFREKKTKKENKKKADQYDSSPDKDSARDDFGNMP